MPSQPTVRGYAALEAFVNYLAPASGRWGPPEKLRGVPSRNGYANHQAIVYFLDELRGSGTRRVHLEDGETVPLSRARFRSPGENPDLSSQEGVFGFGKTAIGLYGTRARMSAPGVLEIADGWGDSVRFGTSAEAAFTDTVWESDEWDLPAPVPPIIVPEGAVERFKPRAAAITASLLTTHLTDHTAADAAIRAHWRACHYRETVPEVRWFAGPDEAITALRDFDARASGLKKTLRDRALMHFDFEVTARFKGRGSSMKDAIWQIAEAPLRYDVRSAVLDRIVARRVQPAFDYLGLVSDFQRLAWYRFLQSFNVGLPEVVATFCAMTAETWLLFPTPDVVFAVERPAASELNDRECALVFANADCLTVSASHRH